MNRCDSLICRLVVPLVAAAICVAAVAPARAQMPDDQVICYSIRDTPSDPESAIRFEIVVELTAADSKDESIGWLVTGVSVIESRGEDKLPRWDATPTVSTTDGLWWIDHADAQEPELSEFTIPPLIAGVAAAGNENISDFEYELEGAPYTPPGGGPPYPTTALVDHIEIWYYPPPVPPATTQPVEDDDDEPVEVDGDHEPHGQS